MEREQPKTIDLMAALVKSLRGLCKSCGHAHFYTAIDDAKYVEKCVLCDKPKVGA